MPADKFRFISPGVQVAEIDRSGIPAEAPAIGPAVIGRATHGPAMQPIRLESTADLYQIFGAPSPGGRGGDVWREGNYAAPTYGLFAAEAYLRNNGPVTFVRLAGEEAPPEILITNEGEAGWEAGSAVGLFVTRADGTAGATALNSLTSSLAAVFYTFGNSQILLESLRWGHAADATPGILFENESDDPRNLTFTVVISDYISGAIPAVNYTASFDFNPDSEKYIRKVFNTNPHYCNSSIYTASLNYFLGETFESSVAEQVVGLEAGQGAPTKLQGAKDYALAFINKLIGSGNSLANRSSAAAVAKTGLVFAQDLTKNTGSYSPFNQQQLFRFAATDIRGDWDNRNVKVSIANIKAATNPTVNPYGTFDVFVRNAGDTDNSLSIIEAFADVNLNPASPDYIARRIGDKYLVWNSNEKNYEEYGTYTNVSKYIRVEMVDEVDNATANPAVLPFGYFGPIRTQTQITGAAASVANLIEKMQFNAVTLKVDGTGLGYDGGTANVSAAFDVKVTAPSLVLRESGSYGVSTPKKAFYGSVAQGTFARRDNGYGDYAVRMAASLGDDIYGNGSSSPATGGEYSYVFTLDDISGSTTAPVYVAGSRIRKSSLRGTGSIDTLLNAGINAFTLPMVGGTDGLDITEPEPFANRLITGQTEGSSYELYSVRKAIDTIRDPDVVEHNIVAVPGISDPLVTDFLVDMAEERRDTMAIIDIEDDYKPRFELTSGDIASNRTKLPDVDSAVTNMKLRGFNTSYGAAYYPAVQVRDRGTNAILYVPATVAAMAALGYTDNVAFPWFAPAGFNRGGLSDGSSGIVATGVSKRLTSRERDELYDVNVNPIAQFPQEGVVIFGQKTLQSTRSALDRVNVRRLLIYVKKEISRIANSILFEPNVRDTWNRFIAQAEPFLDDVKADFGLTDYRLILDETTTTPELIDRNTLYARVLLKPARAIEFIAIDFEIFRSGASFDD